MRCNTKLLTASNRRMLFDSQTFREVNNKSNYIVRSRLDQFYSAVDCSGLSIKLPLNGIENYKVDGKQYCLKPGNFLLVNKGQEISCTIDSSKIVESTCIYFDPKLYSEVLADIQSKNPLEEKDYNNEIVLSEKYHMEDCDLSRTLSGISSLKDFSKIRDEDFISITEQLAMHQLQQKQILNSLNALNYITRQELLKRLRIAKSFIYDNYQKEINLEDIAEVACLSKYHLLRSFKDAFRVTPYQALLERRIVVAKEQLITNSTVNEVALNCGFSDRRSFSRVFKKIEGHTPSNYIEIAS